MVRCGDEGSDAWNRGSEAEVRKVHSNWCSGSNRGREGGIRREGGTEKERSFRPLRSIPILLQVLEKAPNRDACGDAGRESEAAKDCLKLGESSAERKERGKDARRTGGRGWREVQISTEEIVTGKSRE